MPNIKRWFLFPKALNRSREELSKNEVIILSDIYFLTNSSRKRPSVRQIAMHLKFCGYSIPIPTVYVLIKKLLAKGVVGRADDL